MLALVLYITLCCPIPPLPSKKTRNLPLP